MEKIIASIIDEMSDCLSVEQLKRLQQVLIKRLSENKQVESTNNQEYLQLFLDAKKVEGCSERTIIYYSSTLQNFLDTTDTSVRKVTTDQIRLYLAEYQKINNCSNATIDNVRRNMSSFFSWLEEEDHILKSPMRRIHKIRVKKQVKDKQTLVRP